MKRLLHLLLFSVLAASCSTTLPDHFYKKSLNESNYVTNYKSDYVLHINNASTVIVNKQDASNPARFDVKIRSSDSLVTLKQQANRPLFTVITSNDTTLITNRHIYFKKEVNFRDIGGLKTTDGKQVKWGMIFRSDNLSKLRRNEFAKFKSLGIQTVIDLRTITEIKGNEDNLPTDVKYMHLSTVADGGDLIATMRKKVLNGEISEAEAQQLMLNLYYDIIDNKEALRKTILEVLNSNAPIVYHCSAGKDRTGVITALILSILNVDRDTIIKEYLLSNYYRRIKLEKIEAKVKLAKIIKPGLNTKVVETFMSVDDQYINAVFNSIDVKYGGIDAFIKNELNISDAQRAYFIKKFTY